jgi:hypothetical protein
VIKVSFIDSYKQEINPEVVLEIMPELKEDYLQHHPCKWEEVRIQLWSVASSRIEDCVPSIEKYSLLCTPILFDNEDTPGYFTVCDKTMEEQIAEFDQQLGITHEMGCTITNTDLSAEVKVKLVHVISEIDHGNKLKTFN